MTTPQHLSLQRTGARPTPIPKRHTAPAPVANCDRDRSDYGVLQRSATGPTPVGPQPAPSAVGRVLQSAGEPLDPGTRRLMESRIGHDFTGVRVHTDAEAASSARAVGANAYTLGEDLIFAAGRYQPRSDEGQWLLAHELAHVVQQADALPSTGPARIGEADAPEEREAHRVADYVASGGTASISRRAGAALIQADDDPTELRRQLAALEKQAAEPVSLPPADVAAIQNQRNALLARAPAPENTCSYGPGEKEASQRSAGGVETLGEREFLLTDFTPGQSVLKPAHQAFLTKLSEDLQLNNPFTDDVLLLVGSTDCVSEEVAADNALRFARASSAAFFLSFSAQLDRVQPVKDPVARISGSNADAAGRAHNRHVRVSVSKRAPDTPPEPGKKEAPPGQRPVPRFQTFLVRVTSGVSGGEVVALDIVQLQVVDVDQQLEAEYSYAGAGLGGSLLPASKSAPGKFTKVTVDNVSAGGRATLASFAGFACLLSAGAGDTSVTILEVSRGFGRIPLDGPVLVPGASGTCGLIQMHADPGRVPPGLVGPDDDDGA
jgi:hypothetical protein